MTNEEVKALGWAYGRLLRAVKGSDVPVVSFSNNKGMTPLRDFTILHTEAVKAGVVTPDVAEDLAKAIDTIDINGVDWKQEPVIPLSQQGMWEIAFYRGKNGESFSAE